MIIIQYNISDNKNVHGLQHNLFKYRIVYTIRARQTYSHMHRNIYIYIIIYTHTHIQ